MKIVFRTLGAAVSTQVYSENNALNLLLQLDKYAARDDSEKDIVSEVRNFYALYAGASPSCFDRELLAAHFTASGLIVRKRGGSIETLLTLHKGLGIWIQPGGHADGDSNLSSVAAKEVQEETGMACDLLCDGEIIDVDINQIPSSSKVPEHVHYDVRYLFKGATRSNYVMSDESIDMGWKETAVIAEENSGYDGSLRKLVRKALFRLDFG